MAVVYFSVLISTGIWFYLIYSNDKFEPEPVKCVILVGVTGGLMSSIPAAIFNTGFASWFGGMTALLSDKNSFSLAVFSLFVGFNEEIWKAFAAVFILKRLKDFNEPIDALIYSMTIALGFAAFENVEYTLMGGIPALVMRSFTAVPLHVGLASIWGIGIAKAKYFREGKYFVTLIPYVFAASVIHALYDYFQFENINFGYSVVIALAFALALTVFASRKLKQHLRESPFAGDGVCTACGTKNRRGISFCKECGKDMKDEI